MLHGRRHTKVGESFLALSIESNSIAEAFLGWSVSLVRGLGEKYYSNTIKTCLQKTLFHHNKDMFSKIPFF